jgi:maleylacetate reductase
MNAIAHAAEGLYARDGNPIMDLMAEEGIRAIATALPVLRTDLQNLEARTQALYGAWLCGTVLGNVGMALHHKLCHTLGGSFNLPHAEVHTVILPHAIAYNAAAIEPALVRLNRALQSTDAAAALYDLARQNGAPISLQALGMAAHDLDRAADLAMANPYWNPRPIDRNAIRELLQQAWDGTRPGRQLAVEG